MSLRTIEASLYARLQTLLTTASPAGYVAAVVRVAGDRETQAKLESENPTTANVVAIALAARAPVEQLHTSRGSAQQTICAARWRVTVIVRDVRGAQSGALTEANTGLYALIDAVTAVLAGYNASGLWSHERVRLVADGEVRHKPGRYLAVLAFETRYAVNAVEATVTTEEPLLIHGDVNLIPATGTAPNPMTEVEAP